MTVRIKKMLSGALMEHLMGERKYLPYMRAVLDNSLLTDFLEAKGWDDGKNFISVDFLTNAKNKKSTLMRKDAIRNKLYTEGFELDGVKYVRGWRGNGAAKEGSCLFINKEIASQIEEFMTMGIKSDMLVEMESYKTLIASGLKSRIVLNPDNIVVLDDTKVLCEKECISVEMDINGRAVAIKKDLTLENKVNDGMSLMATECFPKWASGYVLLRQHMMKSAALNCDLRRWFRDNGVEEVVDCFGKVHRAQDVELICTKESMKWLKFKVSIEEWTDKVRECGCVFGIVKSAYFSKMQDSQRMSYQMVSCLDNEMVEPISEHSKALVNRLKTSDEFFLWYLEQKKSFHNDYEALLAIVKKNPCFMKSDYFVNRRDTIVNAFVRKVRGGKMYIENADNLTLFGNPVNLLRSAAGMEFENEFKSENGCYCERFEFGKELGGFRSPHNSRNNILYFKNEQVEELAKYFKMGTQCIAVNAAGDLMDRGNGLDFDSDSSYTTDNKQIVELARRCYEEYPTIVNNIPNEKVKGLSLYEIDKKIAEGNKVTGGSSNLAALCQSVGKQEATVICSVLAQISIDSAKRSSSLDYIGELKLLKEENKFDEVPKWWKYIKPEENKNKEIVEVDCAMNRCVDLKFAQRSKVEVTDAKKFLVRYENADKNNDRHSKAVLKLIEEYQLDFRSYEIAENEELFAAAEFEFDTLCEDIRATSISRNSKNIMLYLLKYALSGKSYNAPQLISALYASNPNTFMSCFK